MGDNSDVALDVPVIDSSDNFAVLLEKLATYIQPAIQFTSSFEGLRSSTRSKQLHRLIRHLVNDTQNQYVVAALLALRSYFINLQTDDEPGINQTRAYACEFVAWRLLLHMSEREAIDCLLEEFDLSHSEISIGLDEESAPLIGPSINSQAAITVSRSPVTPTQRPRNVSRLTDSSGLRFEGIPDLSASTGTMDSYSHLRSLEFASYFDRLNALEIAAVSGSKKFLSQRVVQKLVEKIWRGDIVFWEALSVNSVKKARIYNKRKADPFVRLRVPRYLKFLEALFFVSFLALYYAVLVPIQRNGRPPRLPPPQIVIDGQIQTLTMNNFNSISPAEVLLYIWIAGFAYDEFGEYRDAGQAFYATDFWSLWDLGTVAIGLAFFITRVIGLAKKSDELIGISFDILSLEALFLVPRIFSLLSLNSYFGTLIPCLREMTKDFLKFLSLVAILYLGFLTTFTLLARNNFSLREMSWVLVKVFFGSTYLGFDIAQEISPLLGPPLMLIFVCMTNILLITSLISLLSTSLSKILDHAREEYLFIYSVYVLEASTSNRLTYFLPPLNLIPLFLRPLRLFIATDQLRRARIVLLKITHSPFVVAIWAYESIGDYALRSRSSQESSTSSLKGPSSTAARLVNQQGHPSLQNPPLVMGARIPSSVEWSRESVTAAGDEQAVASDDLKSLVLKLMAKIDTLTEQVAEQNRHSKQPNENADSA